MFRWLTDLLPTEEKVYCINCKHHFGIVDACNHPDNYVEVSTYMEKKTIREKSPWKKNFYNNCKDFEREHVEKI